MARKKIEDGLTNYQRTYLKNKEKMNERARNYNKTEKGKESNNRSRKKERDNLTDNYIRQHIYTMMYLRGIKIVRKDIPPEHIEVYRNAITLKRILKEQKNESKQKSL